MGKVVWARKKNRDGWNVLPVYHLYYETRRFSTANLCPIVCRLLMRPIGPNSRVSSAKARSDGKGRKDRDVMLSPKLS